jgi:hypothetical protein
MTFDEWKQRAVKYVHDYELRRGIEKDTLDWLLGGDEDMRTDGYEDDEFWDNPEGYIDYQMECAQ